MFLNGVFIDQAHCFDLAVKLGRAVTLAEQTSGDPTPESVSDLLNQLREAAEPGSARFNPEPTVNLTDTPILASSRWLTTKQAAERAKVSTGYMCRCYREGDLEASRGARGKWLIDADSFNMWLASRQAHQPKAA